MTEEEPQLQQGDSFSKGIIDEYFGFCGLFWPCLVTFLMLGALCYLTLTGTLSHWIREGFEMAGKAFTQK